MVELPLINKAIDAANMARCCDAVPAICCASESTLPDAQCSDDAPPAGHFNNSYFRCKDATRFSGVAGAYVFNVDDDMTFSLYTDMWLYWDNVTRPDRLGVDRVNGEQSLVPPGLSLGNLSANATAATDIANGKFWKEIPH